MSDTCYPRTPEDFCYRPTECRKDYRMVVLRKNISREKGEARLFDEIRYFFYITKDWESTAEEIVFAANGRCDQEDLLSQFHGGCHALRASVDGLTSHWAYMVMTALAWNLKAWWALRLPVAPGRHREAQSHEKRWVLGLEFKAFVRLPCPLIRSGRRLIYRLLAWNPHQRIFFLLVAALRC